MDLFRPKLTSKDPEKRIRALQYVTDDETLVRFIMAERNEKVLIYAISRIKEQNMIYALADHEYCPNGLVRSAAIKNIRDPEKLASIVMKATALPDQTDALKGIIDQLQLANLSIACLRYEKNKWGIRMPVVSNGERLFKEYLIPRIDDMSEIMRILCCDGIEGDASLLIDKINDASQLRYIADNAHSDKVQQLAVHNLEQLGNKLAAAEIKRRISTVNDAETLLDMLIANQENDTDDMYLRAIYIIERLKVVGNSNHNERLARLIKEYGVHPEMFHLTKGMLTGLYGEWNKIHWKSAFVMFFDENDLNEACECLRSNNPTTQLIAINQLLDVYRSGRFVQEIGKIKYKNKSVTAYDFSGKEIVVS